MSKTGVAALLGGMLLGAGLMFWGDPKLGRRRRARTRDRLRGFGRRSGRAFRRTLGRLDGKMTGALARTARRWNPDRAPDCKIRERVRTKLGRLNAKPLDVTVRRGQVTLRGDVPPDVVDALKQVPGVARVEQPSVAPLRQLRQL